MLALDAARMPADPQLPDALSPQRNFELAAIFKVSEDYKMAKYHPPMEQQSCRPAPGAKHSQERRPR